MSNRPKDPKNARNKNILVIGGSGSGKTRFFCKPNIMQLHSSYVITDPKGSLICEVGQLLQRAKYRIAVLNTINFSKSMHYNPFAYLRTEKDILKLVNTIIVNTKGEGAQSTEDFWVKAERLYYTALIGYIHYEAPEEEKNFITLLDMINASDTREDDEDYKNPVDLLFDRLEEREPEHFAVKQYRKYKLAAGKTAKSILISCGARLAPFDIKELRDLMAYDEMELDTIGDKKTALFLIMSDTDSTFNFVIAILQSQLTNLLCDKADDVYGGRLPVHVRFILDEFANIGQIPQFDKLIATIRSREISASIILQSQSQLKAIYRDMLTMRPLDERGAWAAKSKKEYDLDENGERIRLPSGRYKTHKVDLTGWNDKDNTLLWRRAWADYTNDFLEKNGSPERIDHRSNAERGIDEIPTVHMGVAACQMEKKGIATEKGELNRSIQKTNRLIREIRAQIGKLKEWIADLFKARETAPEQPPQSPNLANLLMKYLSVQREKSRKYSQSWQHQHAADELKTISQAANYLAEHGISTLDELDASLSSVSDEAFYTREGMKTAEQRMKELQKLIENGENYLQYHIDKQIRQNQMRYCKGSSRYSYRHSHYRADCGF